MKKKIVFAVGGTGGHVFPAINLAKEIPCEALFLGSKLSTNPYFKRSFPYKDVPSSAKKHALIPLLLGLIKSLYHLLRFRPSLIVGFGSFHAFPTLVAAKILRKPYCLFEPNATPGLVNRLFAKKAQAIFSPFDLPYPQSRRATIPIQKNELSKKEALAFYGFTEEKKTLLIFGGSQGARSLNLLVAEKIDELPPLQIIHVYGKNTDRSVLEKAYKTSDHQVYLTEFEDQMGRAMIAADAALCRCGASTVLELIYYNLPALVVPYPYETDDHQSANGKYFEKVGGGTMRLEKDLDIVRDLTELLEKTRVFCNHLSKVESPPPLNRCFQELL